MCVCVCVCVYVCVYIYIYICTVYIREVIEKKSQHNQEVHTSTEYPGFCGNILGR